MNAEPARTKRKKQLVLLVALAVVLLGILAVTYWPRPKAPPRFKCYGSGDVSADESRIAVWTNFGTMVLSADTGELIKSLPGLNSARWSPTDPNVLAGKRSKTKYRRFVKKIKAQGHIIGQTNVAYRKCRLEVHNLASGTVAAWKRRFVHSWQWSPDGSMIAVGTWPEDRGYPIPSEQSRKGDTLLGFLAVGDDGALLEEVQFVEITGVIQPVFPTWRPDSKRVYFVLSVAGPALLRYLDVDGVEPTLLDTHGFSPGTLRIPFIDQQRLITRDHTRRGLGQSALQYGILNVETMDFEPFHESRESDDLQDIYQTRSGGPVYLAWNGDIYEMDPVGLSFEPLAVGPKYWSGAPVHLASSNAFIFTRGKDMEMSPAQIVCKNLATGKERLLCVINDWDVVVPGGEQDPPQSPPQ